MNLLAQTWAWLTDPMNWSGYSSIPGRLGEHVFYTVLTLAIAAAIALPIGAYVGHTGRGRVFVVAAAGALRAIPTLGLLVLFVLLAGIGLMPPIWALVILTIPPLLAGTYSGIAAVDPVVVDAARAQGMREYQVLLQVELPNAVPVIFGGARAAILQVIATATVVAYTNLGGLGRYIFDGLALSDYPQMLGGSVLVAALAVVTDLVLGTLLRVLGPRTSSAAEASAPAAAVTEGMP
jgi:osmoprotectant transport system permease protein